MNCLINIYIWKYLRNEICFNKVIVMVYDVWSYNRLQQGWNKILNIKLCIDQISGNRCICIYRAQQTKWRGRLFYPAFKEIAIFPPLLWHFSHPISFWKLVIFTNKHTYSSIFLHKELLFPEIWSMQSLIFNILFQPCWMHPLIIFEQHVFLWKIGWHAVSEKQML